MGSHSAQLHREGTVLSVYKEVKMGLFDASLSNGGSINSASSGSQSISNGYSLNYPIAANANAAQQAEIAYQRQKELNEQMMNFNREEAQKARDWETEMANTIYTRSMKNMIEAGINPILAANIGLSGASVGSGAVASMGGSSAPMAQTFLGAESANSANSSSWGESEGSSWNHSESGLATFLQSMAGIFSTISNGLSSGLSINIDNSFDKLYDKLFPPETQTEEDKEVKESIHDANESKKNSNKKTYKGNNHDYSGGLPRTGARGETVVQ